MKKERRKGGKRRRRRESKGGREIDKNRKNMKNTNWSKGEKRRK